MANCALHRRRPEKSLMRHSLFFPAARPNSTAFPEIRQEFHACTWYHFLPTQKQRQSLLKSHHCAIYHSLSCKPSKVSSPAGHLLVTSTSLGSISHLGQSILTCTRAGRRCNTAPVSTRASDSPPVKPILQDHHLENEQHAEVGWVSGDADPSVRIIISQRAQQNYFFKSFKRSEA